MEIIFTIMFVLLTLTVFYELRKSYKHFAEYHKTGDISEWRKAIYMILSALLTLIVIK